LSLAMWLIDKRSRCNLRE